MSTPVFFKLNEKPKYVMTLESSGKTCSSSTRHFANVQNGDKNARFMPGTASHVVGYSSDKSAREHGNLHWGLQT